MDRKIHITMKTVRPQPISSHSFSHVNPHSHIRNGAHSHSRPIASSHSHLPPKSTTPLESPGAPHSVGQQNPPRLSPAPLPELRSPSPNYFGLIVDSNKDAVDSSRPVGNWSPPTSSVKSFAAALPKQVPLDANPDFEAFRRQADLNRGGPFRLGGTNLHTPAPSTPGPSGMKLHPPTRRSAFQNGSSTPLTIPLSQPKLAMGESMPERRDKSQDSGYGSGDSKRNSDADSNTSPSATTIISPEGMLYQSPARMESLLSRAQRSSLVNFDERSARESIDFGRDQSPKAPMQRADTFPSTSDAGLGPTMLTPYQLRHILEQWQEEEFLIIDLRVQTLWFTSRIKGAINLCVPTTLLKRATFDLERVKQSFTNDADRQRFGNWRQTKCIIVYDACSAEKRDAQSAVHMLKKFTTQGYAGSTYILKGGFHGFSTAFSEFVDTRSGSELTGSTLPLNDRGGPGQRPKIAPVIGGVMLPSTQSAANPFFSNIRQNMDLQDGVGQLDITMPQGLNTSDLPIWLRGAANPEDHGQSVSEKFLAIERSEQSRMKDAFVHANSPGAAAVQLCGFEKGGKNRYKDILPFEHARVKLQNKPSGVCDYVNASHIKSKRSNKKYIASQGPLPATFEDFWSVVWDQDVRVIVMLTAESEGGHLKCHPYWCDTHIGDFMLTTVSEKKVSLNIDKYRHVSSANPSSISVQEIGRRRANTTTSMNNSQPTPPRPASSEAPFVVVRTLKLQYKANAFAGIREITHLHYSSWPDFGAPTQPSHLLALVELANVMQRAADPVDSSAVMSSSRLESPEPAPVIPGVDEPEPSTNTKPMLVHCSAGCGRTGTFCTVDTVIDMLKRQRLAYLQKDRITDGDGDVQMEGSDIVSSSSPTQSNTLPSLGSFMASRKTSLSQGEPTLDLSWLGKDDLDLIQKTVEDFREQRISMVQNLRQYVLCYETVMEWIWRAQDHSMATHTNNNIRGHTRGVSLSAGAFLGRRAA